MAKRMCDGCRFYEKIIGNYGNCRRRSPSRTDLLQVSPNNWCGEWRDKTITPEQEQRAELVRRFVLALVATEWFYDRDFTPPELWQWAERLVDAEPSSNP